MFSPPYPPSIAREPDLRPDRGPVPVHQNPPPEQYDEGQKAAYDVRQPFSSCLGEQQEVACASATAQHSKVKLVVTLDRPTFLAGTSITGKMEIISSTSHKLRLGEIAVDLAGDEELRSRDHAASQRFLHNRILFQSSALPPSNAVYPSAPHQDYWTARKGRTTFPFAFPLTVEVPSAIEFAGNAAVRYSIKASLQLWYQDSRTALDCTVRADVIEQWEDEHSPIYWQPITRVGEAKLMMGGSSGIWLEASLVKTLHLSGDRVMVCLGVRNRTKRDTTGVRIEVVRTLSFATGGGGALSHGPSLCEVVHTQHFRGSAFNFTAHSDIVLNLPVDLPSWVRSVRKTKLFNIEISIVSILPLGTLAKDLEVTLPIHMAHPDSVTDPVGLYLSGRSALPETRHVDDSQGPPFIRPNSPVGVLEPEIQRPSSRGAIQSGQTRAAQGVNREPFTASEYSEPITVPLSPSPFTFAQDQTGQQVVNWNLAAFAWTPSKLKSQHNHVEPERRQSMRALTVKPLPAIEHNGAIGDTIRLHIQSPNIYSPQPCPSPTAEHVHSPDSRNFEEARILHSKSPASKSEPEPQISRRPKIEGRSISSKEIELFEEMANNETAQQSSADIAHPESRTLDVHAKSEITTVMSHIERDSRHQSKASQASLDGIAAIDSAAGPVTAPTSVARPPIPLTLLEGEAVTALPVLVSSPQQIPKKVKPSSPEGSELQTLRQSSKPDERLDTQSQELGALERNLSSQTKSKPAPKKQGSHTAHISKSVSPQVPPIHESLKDNGTARVASNASSTKLPEAARKRSIDGPRNEGNRKDSVPKGEIHKPVELSNTGPVKAVAKDASSPPDSLPSSSGPGAASPPVDLLQTLTLRVSADGCADVPSERGGRGGRVTSVKALWTSRAGDSPTKSSSPVGPSSDKHSQQSIDKRSLVKRMDLESKEKKEVSQPLQQVGRATVTPRSPAPTTVICTPVPVPREAAGRARSTAASPAIALPSVFAGHPSNRPARHWPPATASASASTSSNTSSDLTKKVTRPSDPVSKQVKPDARNTAGAGAGSPSTSDPTRTRARISNNPTNLKHSSALPSLPASSFLSPSSSSSADKGQEKATGKVRSRQTAVKKRVAPPLLNTTTPRVHLCSGSSSSSSSGGGGGGGVRHRRKLGEEGVGTVTMEAGHREEEDVVEEEDEDEEVGGEEMESVIGRGTTRVLGRKRMDELRSLWTDKKESHSHKK